MPDERNIIGQAPPSAGSGSHSLPASESGNLSMRLRHAIENKFPHPIARSFYQLRRLSDWLAEVPQIANVLGVTLEHLAIVALAEYLAGERRDARLNAQLLEALRKPLSHGAWAGLLRDTMAYLHETGSQLFAPDLLSLYFPRRSGGRPVTSLRDMGDELVQLRNELLKKSVESLPTYEQQQQFKRRLVEFLQTLGCLKDYPLVAVRQTRMHADLKTHRCYLLTGFHETFEQGEIDCDLDLEAMRVAMLNPASCELLELYPFYVLRECPADGCREMHLFRFERIGHRGIEYVAVRGHKLVDEEAGAALKSLLQGGEWCGRPRRRAKYLCCDFAGSWHQLPAGQLVDDRYEIITHLRRGGMADVYQVRDTAGGGVRALKLLPFQFLSDQKMIQRFRHEAKQSRDFEHPNITRVYSYGEALVDHYLVMELADGWVASDGYVALDVGELPKPLDVSIVLSVVKQACEGLDYIHRKQVIHRDVKPGNLLLFRDGWVKLADFGVARSRESITLTMTGLAMGTPEYMSPEQAEGKRDLTPASDLYSLGVVMYELLTGEPPFKRASPLATAIAHLRDPVPPLSRHNPSIPEPLQNIVLKCLEKKPRSRFRTARELYAAVTAYEGTGRWEPSAARPGAVEDRPDDADDDADDGGEVVFKQPTVRPVLGGGSVAERGEAGQSDKSEGRKGARSQAVRVPPWRNRRAVAATALVALVCLTLLGRFLWQLYSPPGSLIHEAKWHPNDATLGQIINDMSTKLTSIDKYQLRTTKHELLREVHIGFDNAKWALFQTETNLFIKVFVPPGSASGENLSAQWLMTYRVTPEGDPNKIWNRREIPGELKTFPISNASTRVNFEEIVEKIGPPPQAVIDALRERVGVNYDEIGPKVFLGVERLQWVLHPATSSLLLKLQCTRVHAIPYGPEWLAKLGPIADVPTTPLDERWKWNELEIVEEGNGPQDVERRFTERVQPFERQYNLDRPENLDPNRNKMGMAKYKTAVKLLGLY